MTTTTLEPGARVMITEGRWGQRSGRLVSLTETDAVVELAETSVTVAPSMLRVMEP